MTNDGILSIKYFAPEIITKRIYRDSQQTITDRFIERMGMEFILDTVTRKCKVEQISIFKSF
jgi:hypothetical protein